MLEAMLLPHLGGIHLMPLGHMQQTARYLCTALLSVARSAISQAVEAAEQRGFPYVDGGALGIGVF